MVNKVNDMCEEVIYSPVVGNCIPLEQVPDKVFAEKIVGEGMGFIFEGDTIYSPCDGKIIMIASTKHAFAVESDLGTEVLVHIGMDTVALNGEGFEVLANVGTRVKAHEPIIRIDLNAFKKKNLDLTTPLIVTNAEISEVHTMEIDEVDLKTVVCKVKKASRDSDASKPVGAL